GHVHDEALPGEPAPQGGGEPGLVLHHQQPHTYEVGTPARTCWRPLSTLSVPSRQHHGQEVSPMSIFMTRPAARWLVPSVVAAAAIGGGALINTVTASAAPTLPPRSAAQLLVDLQTARLDGMSGTVVERADLGLPSLPGIGGSGSSDLSSLVSDSHTLRVWYSGGPAESASARIALLGTLGETDIVKSGQDVWTWRSRHNTATHQVLPPAESRPPVDARDLPKTPQEAADMALRAIDPTTVVTTGRSARVAGRAAYELVLAPRDTASLIGQVRLAIDAREHVPLRVRVFPARSDKAAVEV